MKAPAEKLKEQPGLQSSDLSRQEVTRQEVTTASQTHGGSAFRVKVGGVRVCSVMSSFEDA